MEEVQDKNEGGMGFATPTQDRVNHSTKKRKRLSQKVIHSSAERARVNIGVAFESWCAAKAAKGLRSDAELALSLLDEMKRPPSPGPSDKKIKLSQSEVQLLIEQEVCSAVKRNETKLEALIESIQNQDRGVEYECSIQKLEARINMMTRRAEAALAFITHKKSSSPSLSNTDIFRISHEDVNVDTASQNKKCQDYLDKCGKLFQIVETTKNALQKLHEDNKNLKAAFADLREDSPTVLTPYSSPGCMSNENLSKKELNSQQHRENNVGKFREIEKPKAERKVECLSSTVGNVPKDTGSEELLYPPLPPVSFPPTLKLEAISYCIPQRPEVHLALIRQPAGLSVLWKVEKEDPSAPPMDSYSIYMTTEKVKGSGIFPDWTLLGEVKAFALPMCVMITRYKCGHKMCVTVVGKDIFGRYGPYSKVVTTIIPG